MSLPNKISDWPAEWRELWEERAAIMNHEGLMPKFMAEREAEKDIRKLAANQ